MRVTTLRSVIVAACYHLGHEKLAFSLQDVVARVEEFLPGTEYQSLKSATMKMIEPEGTLLYRVKRGVYAIAKPIIPRSMWWTLREVTSPSDHLFHTTTKRGVVTKWDKEVHKRNRTDIITINYMNSIYAEVPVMGPTMESEFPTSLIQIYKDHGYDDGDLKLIMSGFPVTYDHRKENHRTVYGICALRWFAFARSL